MKILIFNWRDIKNPNAGGAETLTHECARRWVKGGDNQVTLFTAEFPGCRKTEVIDGVKIIRAGKQSTVHYYAFRHYRKTFKGQYDLAIDEINTVPFFTPLYVKGPKLALINQLCREIWWHEVHFPASLAGFVAEPMYLKLYRREYTVTISDSTRRDLLALGFDEKKVFVIPMGVDFRPLNSLSIKKRSPTMLYVGRLIKSKRVHDIIEAFKLVNRDMPDSELWLVGRSNDDGYENYLRSLVKKSALESRVKFWGYVSEGKKRELMRDAYVLLVASSREGWGLTVTEANALGTPAIGYNIPGLRDSIRHRETGLLTSTNTPLALSELICMLLKDKRLQKNLREKAWEAAKEFTWDRTAEQLMKIIQEAIGGKVR